MLIILLKLLLARILLFMYCSLIVDKFGYNNLSLGADDWLILNN